MRKLTDFIFIDKYCIPIDLIRYCEEINDKELYIYLDHYAFPLIIKDYSIKDLMAGFERCNGDEE